MNAKFRKRGGCGPDDSAPQRKMGRSGKIVTGSLAATVVGAVVKDLSRPNSLILGLVSAAKKKLLAYREPKPALDISGAVEVEIVDDSSSSRTSNDKTNTQEV